MEPQWEQTNLLPSADGGSLMSPRPELDLDLGSILPCHLECLSLYFLTSPLNPKAKGHTLAFTPMALIASSLLNAKKIQCSHLAYWVTDA